MAKFKPIYLYICGSKSLWGRRANSFIHPPARRWKSTGGHFQGRNDWVNKIKLQRLIDYTAKMGVCWQPCWVPADLKLSDNCDRCLAWQWLICQWNGWYVSEMSVYPLVCHKNQCFSVNHKLQWVWGLLLCIAFHANCLPKRRIVRLDLGLSPAQHFDQS